MTVQSIKIAAKAFVPFSTSDIEQSIPARFNQQVRRYPDRTAVKSRGRALTYIDLDTKSNRIAQAILNTRNDIEEPVVLLVRQGASLVAGVMGALKSGKIYVPQDAAMPASTIRRVLDDCCAPLIITDDQNMRLSVDLAGPRAVLNIDHLKKRVPAEPPKIALSPDRAAYIFYTSGSTGVPKGVVDNHRNVLHNIMRYTNNLEISSADRLSLVQASSFSGAVSSLYCALLNGATVFPFDIRRTHAEEWAAWVNQEELSIFHCVPTVFEQLMLTGHRFPSLRIIRLEGDRTTSKHIDLFQKNFSDDCLLVNGLGTTETGLIRQYFVNSETRLMRGPIPVGYPIQDMDICLLDDHGRQAADGEIGEITVSSRYLATGYWQRPKLTKTVFSQEESGSDVRIYRTGDLGILAEDGCLTYLGRKNFEIRIRGQRINVAALENALTEIDGIDDAAVSTFNDDGATEQLAACLVSAAGRTPTVNEIRRRLSNNLPSYEIPSRYVVLDRLPRDLNGKINRLGLPKPGTERPHLEQPFVAPKSHREKLLTQCFAEILGIGDIGIHDNFYDLGGDSLKAVELAIILEGRLDARISSELFFEQFTVTDICNCIDQESEPNEVVVLQKIGTNTPLFVFHDSTGYVWDYRRLVTKLQINRPVYGLEYKGNPKEYPLLGGIEELAAHYASKVQLIQPVGPYLLAGQCFGGLIAFEVAQQLRAQDLEVEQLILMDTPFINGLFERFVHPFNVRRNLRKISTMPLGKAVSNFMIRFTEFAQAVGSVLWCRVVLIVKGRRNVMPRYLNLRPGSPVIHRVAGSRYKVRPYDGSMVFICLGSRTGQDEWQEVTKNGVEIIELPLIQGIDQNLHLTDEPHLSNLIEVLEPILNSKGKFKQGQNDIPP